MATISENLQTIKNSTDAIKQAIIDKGGTVSGDITTWADAIGSIQGGSSGGAGSVFKITNKLNGQLFGGPTYHNSDYETLHSYEFEGGELAGATLLPIGGADGGSFPSSITYYAEQSLLKSYSGTVNVAYLSINFNPEGPIQGRFPGETTPSNGPLDCLFIAVDTNGNYDVDTLSFQGAAPCFLRDTKITLSDDSYKLVQDIDYNDELLVWNFDEGKYDKAKPLWIKKTQISTYYYKVTLDNGTILQLVGSDGKCHRLFSIEDGMFLSATDMVGKTTYSQNGECKVLFCDLIEEKCEYYNIITDYHINLFANGILTSCRYNNIYPIKDMKFIKDDRLNRAPKWKLYEQFREHRVLDRYHDGLRLYEQMDIPLEDTIKYCERLESLRKALDEFSDNKTVLSKIEDTQVGWIDRNGKAYGFKLYMPGQNNHIILANRICQMLNVKSDNPSRYLEKLGWVKYTTDFILNSDDEYINKKQLNTIKKFLNVPGKCKKEGFIKIGTTFDDYTSISDFENMDEYSFEFRKKNNNRNNRVWQQDK